LALLPVEMPESSPRPQAAPRDANPAVAAIDRAAEPAPANVLKSGNARVKSGVNMRARPASGAKVLVTVPRGTTLQVEANCRHWCAATYKGQSGFIYKSFLSF
jgi:SH3-like domain-containing protein